MLIVANFSELPEQIYDIVNSWGAMHRYENLIENYSGNPGSSNSSLSDDFLGVEKVAKALTEAVEISHDKVTRYLEKLGLAENKNWGFVKSKENFNKNVNLTFLSWLQELDTEKFDQEMIRNIEKNLHSSPFTFMKWVRRDLK